MPNADDVLALAASDDGYAETPAGSNRTKYGAWYGLDGNPWCAMAVSHWFFHVGLPLPRARRRVSHTHRQEPRGSDARGCG